jgi:hypothetical protein
LSSRTVENLEKSQAMTADLLDEMWTQACSNRKQSTSAQCSWPVSSSENSWTMLPLFRIHINYFCCHYHFVLNYGLLHSSPVLRWKCSTDVTILYTVLLYLLNPLLFTLHETFHSLFLCLLNAPPYNFN